MAHSVLRIADGSTDYAIRHQPFTICRLTVAGQRRLCTGLPLLSSPFRNESPLRPRRQSNRRGFFQTVNVLKRVYHRTVPGSNLRGEISGWQEREFHLARAGGAGVSAGLEMTICVSTDWALTVSLGPQAGDCTHLDSRHCQYFTKTIPHAFSALESVGFRGKPLTGVRGCPPKPLFLPPLSRVSGEEGDRGGDEVFPCKSSIRTNDNSLRTPEKPWL